jgi:hypothetical protein
VKLNPVQQSILTSLKYEVQYLLRKLRPKQLCIFIISLLGAISTSLIDTKTFFSEATSPLVKLLPFLKGNDISAWLALCMILLVYVVTWWGELSANSREVTELARVTNTYLLSKQRSSLKKLNSHLKKNFSLSDDARLSLFVPVRQGFLKWRLQMICHTDNVPEREAEALFRLNEGAIGYTFLKSRKHAVEFLNLSKPRKLSKSYVPLDEDNLVLISREIQGILVAASFHDRSIAGLLAIDSENLSDLAAMENGNLHGDSLDWIKAQGDLVKLLWRMKNNV